MPNLSMIRNADQTPLTFNIPSKSTIHMKWVKSVTMVTTETTGNEKNALL